LGEDEAMTYEDILYRVEDGVAVITLNRPDRLNAWRGEMGRDVKAAMRAASDDDAVRVIVFTGAGRGFCAGADMNTLQVIQGGSAAARSGAGGASDFDPNARADFRMQNSWFPSVPKPIIGAINGACAGLGMVYAMYTDIRFASDAAVFTTAFSKRGLIAEHGISWLLPRLIGFAAAADLLFSSRKVDAAEALALGLVTRVFPAAEFEAGVMAYAKMLANDVSPRSLREMKRELWNGQLESLGESIAAADADMAGSFASEDFKEGVAHFLEKRPAKFTGR
jgi:enoyl-CoA hydratase/carnithine racemase